jgi:alanyl-tRNA synthetase
MQPLVPYLLGQKHPAGVRLANSQKCFRSEDMDEVGDNRHTTFFEMLGNWSLGDYFKQEQLLWLFEFLTKEVGLPAEKLYVTVFAGESKYEIPKDIESAEIWKRLFSDKGIAAKDIELGSIEMGGKVGMQGGRIFYYDARKNWWSRSGVPENMPVGEPGGPDSEIFYEFTQIEHNKKFGEYCHPNCDCGRFMEIGNSVFMEYRKTASGFEKLAQKNVDFGGGLERIAAAANNEPDIFRIDAFAKMIESLETLTNKNYSSDPQSFRIIADHIRASVFLISDGVTPSNTDRGYVLRKLIRRAVRRADNMGIKRGALLIIVEVAMKQCRDIYENIRRNSKLITDEIENEEVKFREAYRQAMKVFENYARVSDGGLGSNVPSADKIFELITSHGLSRDIIEREVKKRGIEINWERVEEKFKKHQELSRSGAGNKFKGGLADTSEMSVRYHTATHLLHQALHDVLGEGVGQKGSNITSERLRFDFSYPAKMTDEQKQKVEDIVNEKIKSSLPVNQVIMPKAEAERTGARHFFGEKYGDKVSIYYIGNDLETAYSKEFCGGPHIKNTSELGHFKIIKEEAVSAGIRRIKATINNQ